eukprot:6275357-Amphidinium_carterae.1
MTKTDTPSQHVPRNFLGRFSPAGEASLSGRVLNSLSLDRRREGARHERAKERSLVVSCRHRPWGLVSGAACAHWFVLGEVAKARVATPAEEEEPHLTYEYERAQQM